MSMLDQLQATPMDRSAYFDRIDAVQQDQAFKRAMLAARDAGREQFTTGVIVDLTPLVPKHFYPEARWSLMGSSGAACASSGDTESIPERMIPSMGAAMR